MGTRFTPQCSINAVTGNLKNDPRDLSGYATYQAHGITSGQLADLGNFEVSSA
jgi:hypothetical protein